MRLLHFDELGRLALTNFENKTIPPYAILSHRWGDGEVLFEDVASHEIFLEDLASEAYKDSQGYRKLQFCAERAAQDKLQYFWVDTCCIDKWNLRELSKSINSMFQWYKNAARCYVFLSDVSTSTTTETPQRSDWEASFCASEWFTRGWTLQELIAPVSVEFFSCEGQRIGDKTSLDELIHKITDIPLPALRNCSLDQFTTSERSQWADKRKTTEDEDIVYCLLGILGVSMLTTYGEGRESARSRLRTELEAAGEAPSIIPFSQNHRFVGRESQLAELEANLFSNEQTTGTTLAILGPGGTGKSQLALEIAHRTKQNKRNCSVFWIDASDKDSLYRSYAVVAQKLGISGWDDIQADMKQLAKRCVVEISTRQCMLIFDNADKALRSGSSSTAEAADLIDFLPHSKLCSVIVTTTNRGIAEALASQNVVELQELTPDAARRMLQTRLATPLSNTNAEQQETDYLLKELSYLPLAIVQAAACMNASGMTLQEYQLQLDEHKGLAIEHSGDSSEGELQGFGMGDPVAATLFLSMDQIVDDHTLAAGFLCLAACVDRKDISLELLAASPQAREDAIKVLDRYALVTRRPAESALDVHRLVHQALRKRLRVEGWLTQWTQHTITQLLRVFPDDDHRNRSKWRRLLSHVQYALSHSLANDNDEERLLLVIACATSLYEDGRYKEAEELEVQVMQISKRVLGNEHPDTLTSMGSLALTYWGQGRWKEAEELDVQALQIQKRVLGDEHHSTLTSMHNLASIYWSQGRLKEAEELQVRVLQINKRVLGNEHLDTIDSMHNLTSTYWYQGRWKEAEELNVQVLQTRKSVLGNEHPDTLTSINNLASTYWNQGQREEAEELLRQVLQIKKRVLGDEHPDTLLSMSNLAFTLWSQARYGEALVLMEQCFQSRQQILGEQHTDTQASFGMLNLWRAEYDGNNL
jgi:tetratricopeptide (TPR) repeat protein